MPAFVECRIAEIEMESKAAVGALQEKLEETARERNQIEAEKIDYQLRLVEAEKATYALEKSIDALKEKMKDERSLKEAAFAKEREVIQTLADRVSKEVELKNEQLQVNATIVSEYPKFVTEIARTKAIFVSKSTVAILSEKCW